MTDSSPDDSRPKTQLDTSRGGSGRKIRTAIGLGDTGGGDAGGGARHPGEHHREFGTPVAAVFGEVEPEFIYQAASYVIWVNVHEIERANIDIFISDLTIKEPRLERNLIEKKYGFAYGLATAKRITQVINGANVLFIVDEQICDDLSMLADSGYRGLLLKQSVPKLLRRAIGCVARGVEFLDPEINRLCFGEAPLQYRLAPLIKSQLTVHFASNDPELAKVIETVQARLRRAWFPPKVETTVHVVLSFTVDAQGMLVDVDIVRPSGNAIADDAAAKAISRAAPFPELPANVAIQVDLAQLDVSK